MILRRLFFLAVVVLIAHAIFLTGRRVALNALNDTYGSVGVDDQGRVRHWYDYYGIHTRILSADEVEEVGIREGAVDTQVRLTAGLPLKDRRRERKLRRADHTADARQLMAFPYSNSGTHLAIALRGTALELRVSDYVLRRKDATGQRIYDLAYTNSIPIEGEFSHIDMQVPGTYDGRFVCVLNNEYWILTETGEFVQRQPLGHDVSLAQHSTAASGVGQSAARAFLLPGASFRPDRIPLRLIVARPGHDVIGRLIVLEPATEEQRWIAAGFGAMAALRPVPLLVAAMAWGEPTDPRQLFRAYWIDPYLAQGANVGWFAAAVAITLACAWFAFRWGQVRLASMPDCAFWVLAVLALGPIGLIWMRMSIPGSRSRTGAPSTSSRPLGNRPLDSERR